MFDTVMSSVQDFVYIFDLSGRFAYVNQPLLNLWQKTFEQAIGKNFYDLDYPKDLADKLQHQIQEVITTSRPLKDETLYTSAFGTRAYEYIFVPLIVADGAVEAVAGVTRDITGRKHAEAERERLLRSQEAKRSRLAYLFTQTPAFVAVLRGPEHVFELVNPHYLQLTGQRDVIGKCVREALPEIKEQGYFELLDEVFRTGEPHVGSEMRIMVQREPGGRPEERFVDFVYQPMFAADESVSGIFVHGVDITERKRAEDAMRESEEWLRAIFEASRDGILVEDEERITYVNQSYTSLFGYEGPGELIGKHVSTVISPEDVERLLEFGRRRARGEVVASIYEFKGKRKDGSLIDVEASVSISTVAGQAYITTTVRDIAERKRAEESLRQAHDELERRVAERTVELAHTNETLQAEIRERTRMEEARRLLLQQLVTAQEDERRRISRELHDQMGQHLAAMVLLVNSLKDFPQLETATDSRFEQLEEVAQQISREVDTLAWELRPIALDDLGLHVALGNYVKKWSKRSGVPVDFHSTDLTDRRLPPQIETALYRLAQEALTNIIKHAQATYVGFILERRDNQVSVIIEDDGCGFDVEALLATPAGERRMGILGMQERTTLVGGTLNIESTLGAGTTIFVRIPLTCAAEGKSL